VRSALQGQDLEAVRRATDELNASMQKIGAAVYGQAEGAPGGTPPEEEAPEGTVEGEFREV
jgi:molecular chaperone DnaK